MTRPTKFRLGDLLVQDALITNDQLMEALGEQQRSGRKLGKVLVEKGFVNEEQIAEALARQLDLPFLNLKYYNINAAVSRRLPEAQARRHRAMVLEEQERALLVAMVDPTDIFAYDELTRQLRREIRIAVVSETMLFQTIDRVYRRTEQITDLARELGEDFGEVIDFGEMTAGLGAEDVALSFTPEAVARAADVIQIVIADPPAVRAILARLRPVLGPGKVVVQAGKPVNWTNGDDSPHQISVTGKALKTPGYYVEPTVFTNVNDKMSIVREEI